MKKILLATVATIGLAGTAFAADLRMPVKAAPVIAPAFNWSGCYLGGYVGGAFQDRDTVYYQRTGALIDGVVIGSGYGYKADSSFIGGGTVGCNYQAFGSPWVIGLEGEIGYLSLSGDRFYGAAAPFAYSSTKIGDVYGLIAGRLGYSWDRALLYVKGGAAFIDVESAVYVPAVTTLYTTKTNKATWTIGAGLEWAFTPNWSVKAEYMYLGLDYTQGIGAPAYTFDQDQAGIHTAKIGLNYRFGGKAPVPVLAKY